MIDKVTWHIYAKDLLPEVSESPTMKNWCFLYNEVSFQTYET